MNQEQLSVVQLLHRLGGVATRGPLVAATSRYEFNRAVEGGEIIRDGHGRYALPVANEALRAAHRLSGVMSHRSAALHWGWEVKAPPPLPDVMVPRNREISQERRAGVALHWANLTQSEIDGPATSRERTLIDCLRSLEFDEALSIADSARRHGSVTQRRLIDLANSVKGPGAPQARRVAREATHLAANPFESVLRAIALDVPGLDLRPQQVVSDATGSGRADLVDRDRRLVVEAESHSWHSRRGDLRRDCRRYTKLVLLGWRVLRFAWEDVMFYQDYVRECLVEVAALPAPGRTRAAQGRSSEGGTRVQSGTRDVA